MRKKAIIISLVLFVAVSFVLTGCGAPGPGPGPQPPPPVPCSLRLISRDINVWGEVYIDGQPRGQLVANSSITIPGMPCGGSVQLQLVGWDGAESSRKTVQIGPSGTTTVDLYIWPWLWL